MEYQMPMPCLLSTELLAFPTNITGLVYSITLACPYNIQLPIPPCIVYSVDNNPTVLPNSVQWRRHSGTYRDGQENVRRYPSRTSTTRGGRRNKERWQ